MPQGLADQFELVERLDGSQNRGRVRALAAPGFEPAPFSTALEQGI